MREYMMMTNELKLRQERVQQSMQKMNVDGCLLSIDVNLYYMTGYVFSGYYYLPVEGNAHWFIKRPNSLSGNNISYIRKPEQIIEIFKANGWNLPKKILLETDEIAYNECIRVQSALQLEEIGNASTLMRQVREIKTPYEIEQIRISAEKHAEVYAAIKSCFREGMTDIQFQVEIEQHMRMNGSIGIFQTFGMNMNIFMGSVLAGSNAEAPSPFDFALGGGGQSPLCPIGANGIVLKEGMTVMVDMAGNYTSYLTDMTRVFSVGKISELAYRAHQVALDIQDDLSQTAGPGTSCADIYNKALVKVEKEGMTDYFMGTKQQAKFVGHGIGLQINELPVLMPRSKEVLQPNMVFAFEPKFVIPGVGAVGIENSFLVTEDRIEKLTLFEEEIIPLC
jgi:Xaa-Pro aminopeptidase